MDVKFAFIFISSRSISGTQLFKTQPYIDLCHGEFGTQFKVEYGC